VYGSLRHILRGIETAGREYAFVSGGFYFAGVVDLKAGNLFLSSCADCKKRSVPRGIVAEKNRGDKIEHGQIARKDGQFSQI
jgi:hypothetical protein